MNNLLKQGWADYDQGQHTDALRAAQTVLTLTPNLPMALALKAMCELWLTDNVAGTVRTLKKLVKSYPNFPRLHISLGAALGFSGDMEAAEKCYLKALELNPNNFGTYHFLATIRKYDRIEPFAAHMLELVESGRLSEQQECPLRFALAKIFADMRDYEQAVKHVLCANELTAGHYNPAASEAHLDSLKTLRDDGGFRSLKPSGVGS